jgi:hypothetical protein
MDDVPDDEVPESNDKRRWQTQKCGNMAAKPQWDKDYSTKF